MDAGDIQRRFGQRVRELRLEKELTQEDLAFESGMDRTYINSIEQGRRNVSLVNIVRIAEALKIEPGELLSLKRSKQR